MFVMITTFLGVLSPELLEHLEVPVLIQDSSPPPAQRLDPLVRLVNYQRLSASIVLNGHGSPLFFHSLF